ncbi:hypothetical protein PCE1_005014 [Barthelona sp. PCE]
MSKNLKKSGVQHYLDGKRTLEDLNTEIAELSKECSIAREQRFSKVSIHLTNIKECLDSVSTSNHIKHARSSYSESLQSFDTALDTLENFDAIKTASILRDNLLEVEKFLTILNKFYKLKKALLHELNTDNYVLRFPSLHNYYLKLIEYRKELLNSCLTKMYVDNDEIEPLTLLCPVRDYRDVPFAFNTKDATYDSLNSHTDLTEITNKFFSAVLEPNDTPQHLIAKAIVCQRELIEQEKLGLQTKIFSLCFDELLLLKEICEDNSRPEDIRSAAKMRFNILEKITLAKAIDIFQGSRHVQFDVMTMLMNHCRHTSLENCNNIFLEAKSIPDFIDCVQDLCDVIKSTYFDLAPCFPQHDMFIFHLIQSNANTNLFTQLCNTQQQQKLEPLLKASGVRSFKHFLDELSMLDYDDIDTLLLTKIHCRLDIKHPRYWRNFLEKAHKMLEKKLDAFIDSTIKNDYNIDSEHMYPDDEREFNVFSFNLLSIVEFLSDFGASRDDLMMEIGLLLCDPEVLDDWEFPTIKPGYTIVNDEPLVVSYEKPEEVTDDYLYGFHNFSDSFFPIYQRYIELLQRSLTRKMDSAIDIAFSQYLPDSRFAFNIEDPTPSSDFFNFCEMTERELLSEYAQCSMPVLSMFMEDGCLPECLRIGHQAQHTLERTVTPTTLLMIINSAVEGIRVQQFSGCDILTFFVTMTCLDQLHRFFAEYNNRSRAISSVTPHFWILSINDMVSFKNMLPDFKEDQLMHISAFYESMGTDVEIYDVRYNVFKTHLQKKIDSIGRTLNQTLNRLRKTLVFCFLTSLESTLLDFFGENHVGFQVTAKTSTFKFISFIEHNIKATMADASELPPTFIADFDNLESMRIFAPVTFDEAQESPMDRALFCILQFINDRMIDLDVAHLDKLIPDIMIQLLQVYVLRFFTQCIATSATKITPDLELQVHYDLYAVFCAFKPYVPLTTMSTDLRPVIELFRLVFASKTTFLSALRIFFQNLTDQTRSIPDRQFIIRLCEKLVKQKGVDKKLAVTTMEGFIGTEENPSINYNQFDVIFNYDISKEMIAIYSQAGCLYPILQDLIGGVRYTRPKSEFDKYRDLEQFYTTIIKKERKKNEQPSQQQQQLNSSGFGGSGAIKMSLADFLR